MDIAGGRDGANPKGDDNHLESGGNHHHDDTSSHRQYFSGVALKIAIVFVVIGIACLVLNQSAYPTQLFQRSYTFSVPKEYSRGNVSSCDNHGVMQQNFSSPFHDQLKHEDPPSQAKEENELTATLRKAAMKDNKTVIITTLNAAWTEPNTIFDLFLESFRIGNGTQNLLKHVVVGAMDQKAYSRCLEANLHCYALTTDGVDFSGEARFMSDDYLKLVWRKIHFQRTVLQMGYDFVFTDGDVMWLRDPFPRFYPDGDFQIACDHYWFTYTDLRNSPNSGFIYAKSNNRTIQFYNFWYTGRDYFPGKHDQDVLNFIKGNPFTQKTGLKIRFFETAYFSGFCEPSKDLDKVITMHANCCIGLENKIHDIKMVIDDWKKYMSLPSGVDRNLSSRSWTVPRICG